MGLALEFFRSSNGAGPEKGDTKWAVGGSFAIFWWECLFGLAKNPVSWNDIDISLNYGEYIFIDKMGIYDVKGNQLREYPNIDFSLTQKIANQILEWCDGEIIAPPMGD